MKCQYCGKNDATIEYHENINGVKKNLHICQSCANKMGLTDFSSFFSPMFVSIPEYSTYGDEEVCSKCGYTLDDYTKTGMFGCEECYNKFSNYLDELFLKTHGKNRHVKLNSGDQNNAKKSLKDKKDDEILVLKRKLKKVIEEENYEEAAVIRDKIKEIEKNMKEGE